MGTAGKKDYSQWASAAAFQENKAFLETDDGGDDGGGGDGEERRTTSRSQAAADPVAPRQPTMPDGTRGFKPGAGRGSPSPAPAGVNDDASDDVLEGRTDFWVVLTF